MVWEIKQGIDLVPPLSLSMDCLLPYPLPNSETMEGMLEGGYETRKQEGKQLIDIFSPLST